MSVQPSIIFDAAGSDTAASGDNTVAALSGTAGNVTSGSTSATITDAVDLSGVPTSGAAVLWINTTSGRQFSKITAISGSSGAWTLTLEDSVWTTSTNKSWAIGGKRQTIDNANSRKLFTADAKAGWTITIDGNMTTTSGISLAAVGDTTNGPLTITGNSDVTRPIINCSANATIFTTGSARYVFGKLQLTNSNASKTSAVGILLSSNSNAVIDDCVLGDATNQLLHGVVINSAVVVTVKDTEVKNCTGAGVLAGTGSSVSLLLDNVKVHDNAAIGVSVTISAASFTLQNSTIYNNTLANVSITSAVTGQLTITNDTIDGASTAGIDLGSAAHSQVVIYDNNVTGNGTYGVSWTLAAADAVKALIDYNCFGSGSATDGPANASGAYNGVTAGPHDQIGVSPNYAGRGSSPPNFTLPSTSNVLAKGYPDSSRSIGGNTGGTTTYETIGASQPSLPAGGGGVVEFGSYLPGRTLLLPG